MRQRKGISKVYLVAGIIIGLVVIFLAARVVSYNFGTGPNVTMPGPEVSNPNAVPANGSAAHDAGRYSPSNTPASR